MWHDLTKHGHYGSYHNEHLRVSFITCMQMQVLDHANEKAHEHVTFGELIDLKNPATWHDMMTWCSVIVLTLGAKTSLFTFEINC